MQYYFSFNETHNYNPDDFIVSASNQEVIDFIDLWPNWGNNIYSRILFVNGSRASGKTHISYIFQAKTGAVRINYNDIACSNNLLKIISMNDCLIFEDIEQNLFDEKIWFHFLNLVAEQKKFLLLTSSVFPAHLNIALPDLRSRINALHSMQIHSPDDELIKALLIKNFTDANIRINIEIINYITSRIDRSFHSISEFINLVNKKSMAEKKPITIPFVRDILLALEKSEESSAA